MFLVGSRKINRLLVVMIMMRVEMSFQYGLRRHVFVTNTMILAMPAPSSKSDFVFRGRGSHQDQKITIKRLEDHEG